MLYSADKRLQKSSSDGAAIMFLHGQTRVQVPASSFKEARAIADRFHQTEIRLAAQHAKGMYSSWSRCQCGRSQKSLEQEQPMSFVVNKFEKEKANV